MKLTFERLLHKIWTLEELTEFANLLPLRKEVNRAISVSPFDSDLRIADDLLRKAIRSQARKGERE